MAKEGHNTARKRGPDIERSVQPGSKPADGSGRRKQRRRDQQQEDEESNQRRPVAGAEKLPVAWLNCLGHLIRHAVSLHGMPG